jgi:hypothetical protein
MSTDVRVWKWTCATDDVGVRTPSARVETQSQAIVFLTYAVCLAREIYFHIVVSRGCGKREVQCITIVLAVVSQVYVFCDHQARIYQLHRDVSRATQDLHFIQARI